MKKRILFVDDDPNALQSLRAVLHRKRKEFQLDFALSGMEALGLIQDNKYDVVVADMRMPGMDGATLLEKTQQLQPGAVRMILSGYSEMDAVMKAVKSAHQFLAKPCDADVLIGSLERVSKLDAILLNEAVREKISCLGSLPALSKTYTNILEELGKKELSLDRLGDIVAQDPSVSATLLKLVNSAFFGFFSQVYNPVRAVTLLGTETLKGLVLGIHLLSEFKGAGLEQFSLERLWEHSYRTGLLAKAIASMESEDPEFIDCCYVGGLLHDVGKLLLAQEFQEEYGQVLHEALNGGGFVCEVEKKRMGVSHAEVGAYLLGIWSVAEPAVFAVFNHHDLGRDNGKGFTPALCVHVANTLEYGMVIVDKEQAVPLVDMEQLEQRGLAGRLPEWTARCAELLEKGNG